MDKKEKVKNEENKKSFCINAKEEDFVVDEKIDDKYTKNLFERYKTGENKNNKWFTASGILSVAFGIICIVTMIVVGIVFASTIDQLKELAVSGQLDFEKRKMEIIVCCIVIPLAGIFSILTGLQICKFAKMKKEEISSKSIKIFLFAAVQFFIGGVIFSALTIVGYFVGISSDYGVIFYNRIDKGDSIEKQLHNAKLYHQNNLINDEEYENLKQEILKDKEIYF